MSSIIYDINYAFRLLKKSPIFSLITILVLAGGLGMSIFAFSMVNTFVYKALPLEEGEDIVRVFVSQDGYRYIPDAYDFSAMRADIKSLQEIGVYASKKIVINDGDITRGYSGVSTDWNIFEFARVKPLHGRGLLPQDSEAGAPAVIVLSYRLWQSMFNGDLRVLDSSIQVNSTPVQVVGIMPKDFAFPMAEEFWMPIGQDMLNPVERQKYFVDVYGRIKPGYSRSQVDAELTTLIKQVQFEHRQSAFSQQLEQVDYYDNAYVQSFPEGNHPNGAGPIIFSLVNLIALFVLLLACINVGNLMLARANERIKEIAIRVAVGARRSRLVIQMMWESVIICSIGGGLALLLAALGLNVTNDLISANFTEGGRPFWWQWGLDAESVQASFAFIVLAVVFTGVIPAWKTSRVNVNTILRDGTKGAQSQQAGRFTKALIMLQIVLVSVVMILGIVASTVAYKIVNIDFGMNPDNILAAPSVINGQSGSSAERQLEFSRKLKLELEQSPAIDSVILMSMQGEQKFRKEGDLYNSQLEYPEAHVKATLGALTELGISLNEGRLFSESDNETSFKAAVVSQTLANTLWPGESALSKRFQMVNSAGESEEFITVVGVVSDVVEGNPLSSERSSATIYLPLAQSISDRMMILLKHGGDERVAKMVFLNTAQKLEPQFVPGQVLRFEKLIEQVTMVAKSITSGMIVAAIAALLLAVIGIYGLSANSIIQRTQEIGLRRALGARNGNIIGLFMISGSRQTLYGLAIGVGIAILISIILSEYVELDLSIYVLAMTTVPVGIITVVLLAIFIAINKAVAAEPAQALRHD